MDEIIFVNEPPSSLLNAAFNAVSEYENICPKRLSSCEVIKLYPLKPSKDVCFVLARFDGECYDHLRSLGVSIYGPQVILHYVRENKPLPNLPYPLFSTALLNATATVTSVTGAQRKQIFDSIQMLHGSVSRDLTDNVNVIVTAKVGSKKYLVGASRNLHILLPDWITEAWRLSEIQDPIDMMLGIYTEKYRVPIFSQLVICVSGLSVEERKEVSDLVSKHGGKYSGVMKIGETTHLVTRQASGTKYVHAKKWKIQIISIKWLIDSVDKGYALDEEDYRVDQAKTKSSTPTPNTQQNEISFDNISAISYVGAASKVDETRSVCFRESAQVVSIQSGSSILSGCSIRFSDCKKDEVHLYSSIVRELGGKLCTELFDQVTEMLTHVVVGSIPSSNNMSREKGVKYIKGAWLLACRDSKVRIPEDEYLIPEINENFQRLEDEVDVTSTNIDAADFQLINQYFTGGLADDEFQDEAVETRGVIQGFDKTSIRPEIADEVKHPEASEISHLGGCFSNLVFSFHKELSDADIIKCTDIIKTAGGCISDNEHNVNFLVTPFFVTNLPLISSCEFVTVGWISYCIHEKSLCLQEIRKECAFKPVLHKPGPPPLSGCVISLSGFVGNDRGLLTSYAQALGAVVQECFLRKSVASRNLAASTHLVAAKPDGRKWPAAQQWGLPAVSRLWLYKCAETWSLVNECEFPVYDTSKDSRISNNEDLTVISEEVKVRECGMLKNIPSFRKSASGKTTENPEYNLALSNLAETMQTPDWLQDFREGRSSKLNSSLHSLSYSYKPSPTFSVQVSRCLKNAVQETSALPKRKLELSDDEEDSLCLRGVVICVAKHLSSRQVELNDIVKKLGGDFKWTYNPEVCTHMISETSPDDTLPPSTPSTIPVTPSTCPEGQLVYADVAAAKQDGKYLVNPKWLTSCMVACCRLPESDFPPTCLDGKTSVSTSPVEPQPKAARVASLNLFGDINRRLGMMIAGNKTNCFQNGFKNNFKENMDPTTNTDGSHQQFLNKEDQNLENGEFIDSQFPSVPTGHRRLRRNPRRSNYSTTNRSDTTITSHESKSNNDNDNDRSKVRWKYEDDTPHQTTTTTTTTSTDLVISKANCEKNQSENKIEQTLLRENITQKSDNQSSFKSPIQKQQQPQQPDCLSPKRNYIISFTGLSLEERDRYAEIVERLGGEVDNLTTLSEKTTHLIVYAPTRSEKCLICLASGKWMLHKSYLDACSRESCWVDEAAYEWGGPGTEPLLMQLSPFPCPPGGPTLSHQQKAAQIRDLARSARRWRLSGGKAFHNWKVIFGPGCDKESSFRRIIEAGGGKVLSSSPPYPPAHEVTHAFVKINNNSAIIPSTLPRNYSWLRIDYLCSYLSSGEEISKSEFTL
uniref:Putative topbp1 n=1 Tax=Schistosoma mansoni TaxID=6183 RepID=A0A3Q0KM56_SCHMA